MSRVRDPYRDVYRHGLLIVVHDIGHPYLITALFEIGSVAYFGPKQDTFDQKTLLFLLQYGVTF